MKFEIYLFDKALSPNYNSFIISGNDEEDAVIEEESGTPEVVEDEVVADTENLEEEEILSKYYRNLEVEEILSKS